MFCNTRRIVEVEDIEQIIASSVRAVDMPWNNLWLEDDFMEATELAIVTESGRRSRALPVDQDDITWKQTLLPSQLDRAELYGILFDGRCPVFDLDHNLSKRPRKLREDTVARSNALSSDGDRMVLFPCLISHFCMFSNHHQRLLCVYEAAGLHGIPARDHMECEFLSEFPLDLMALVRNKVISYSEAKSMIGNGWHLPTQGLWLVAWHASVELRHDLEAICKPLSPIEIPSDDEIYEEVSDDIVEWNRMPHSQCRMPGGVDADITPRTPKRSRDRRSPSFVRVTRSRCQADQFPTAGTIDELEEVTHMAST